MKPIIYAATFLLCLISASGLRAECDQWHISAENDGYTARLKSCQSAAKYDLSLMIDSKGNPVKGTVSRNSSSRAANSGEINLNWNDRGGQIAWWNHMATNNRLTSFNPSEGQIPQSLYGNPTRVTLKSGKTLIGLLNPFEGNPDWIILNIKGNTVRIFKDAVAELHEIAQ